jgi:transposase
VFPFTFVSGSYTEKIALEQRHHELVAALRSAHTELLNEIDEKDRALRDVLLQ